MSTSERALNEGLQKIADFIGDQEELDSFGFVIIGAPKDAYSHIEYLSTIPIPQRVQVMEDLLREMRARLLGKYTIIEG